MAKKYAATRAAATKDKSKEECREREADQRADERKKEAERVKTSTSAICRDHQDKPGTDGPKRMIQQGTTNSTRETDILQWNAGTCKNTYLENTKGAKSNQHIARGPEQKPRTEGMISEERRQEENRLA
ncbi:hypothetical protein F2Q70_00039705 [Brassica cretica]|uniref:Uncharacterized protein n=1 Tax=Brassica cretica TaxID=69181 RepID=A0A8S9KE57_BRACR|nr:hypothetical protein F2Q70_00039705 [Brassica cretica]